MKQQLVIIGAGGHAKVIIELFEQMDEFQIVGCTSHVAISSDVLGYPVLGSDEILPELFRDGVKLAFCAVGHNGRRQELCQRCLKIGFALPNAISFYAAVSPRASLGDGIAIMAQAAVNVDARIDRGAIINTGAGVDHDCRVGSFVHVGPGARVCGSVEVGEGTFLGAGSTVIDKISIGRWATVGAGSVVVKPVPDRTTVVGVPARTMTIKKRNVNSE